MLLAQTKLSLFKFPSRHLLRQGQHCIGIPNRCIYQLAERQRTFHAPYSTVSNAPPELPANRTSVAITHEHIGELSRALLHNFRKNETLATAMVHTSLLSNSNEPHEVLAEIKLGVVQRITRDNEKLELIGVKVLGLLACSHFLKAHPTFDEGQLTQVTSSTISSKDHSRYCRSIGIDSFLVTAPGVDPLSSPSFTGNFFEALLGALFTDGGLRAASKFFSKRVSHLLEMNLRRGENINSKALLQEHLVASGLPGHDLKRFLKFVPVSSTQKTGKQSFTQAIHVLGQRFSIGTASSRVKADQVASTRLLSKLKERNRTASFLIRLARKTSDKKVLGEVLKGLKKDSTSQQLLDSRISKPPHESLADPIPVTITHQRIDELSRELGHNFRNKETLATAMVHSSLLSTSLEPHEVFVEIKPGVVRRITEDYERLEHLGDKVLGVLMCDHLLKTHPTFDKGQLTQAISCTVSNKNLSRYCRSLRLDSFLETAHSVRLISRSSQPGNFFEALLGALYTDGGLPAASRFFSKRVSHLLETKLLRGSAGNSKVLLQEHLVASGLPGHDLNRVLKYVPVSAVQEAGRQSYTQAIHVLGQRFTTGTADSRTEANQIAATRLLASLKKKKSTACVLIRLARKTSDKEVLARAMKVRQKQSQLAS